MIILMMIVMGLNVRRVASTREWREVFETRKPKGNVSYDSVLSMSRDGSMVAVAYEPDEWDYPNEETYVRVYSREDGFETIGQDIVGRANAIDMSSNGTYLVVGSSDGYPPYVTVRRFDGDTWRIVGQPIEARDSDFRFGCAVALSEDGGQLTVAVGMWRSNYKGAVRTYRFDDATSTWTQLGQDILGDADYGVFGASVSLSNDRENNQTTLAIAGHTHVKLFSRGVVDDDLQQNWTLDASHDLNVLAAHGRGLRKVSLSADGQTLAVANQEYASANGKTGRVDLFRKRSGEWVRTRELFGGSTGEQYGHHVSISGDGSKLAVTADTLMYQSNCKVRVYRDDDEHDDVVVELTVIAKYEAVISADGETCAMTNPSYDVADNGGGVRIYRTRPGEATSTTEEIEATTTERVHDDDRPEDSTESISGDGDDRPEDSTESASEDDDDNTVEASSSKTWMDDNKLVLITIACVAAVAVMFLTIAWCLCTSRRTKQATHASSVYVTKTPGASNCNDAFSTTGLSALEKGGFIDDDEL